MQYSIELEKSLLEKMKEQVHCYDVMYYNELKDEYKENNEKLKKWKRWSIAQISVLIFQILISKSLPTNPFTIIFALILFSNFGYRLIKKKNLTKIKEDFDKNKLFIEKELTFKSSVTKDMGIYKNINRETMQFIDKINQEKEKETSIMIPDTISFPNINDIDKISYNAVMELDDLIIRNEKVQSRILTKRKN